MSAPTILAVLVDALRHDFPTASAMPWTASLAADGVRTTVEETFGFIGVRAAAFYGLHPSDAGYVFLYEVDRGRGDYRFLRPFPDRLMDRYPGIAWRGVKWHTAAVRRRDPEYPGPWDLSRVPPKVLKHVRVAERTVPWSPTYLPGRRSVFDAVDGDFLYLGYPKPLGRTDELVSAFHREYTGQRLVWMHFSEPDWREHEHGASSPEVQACLADVDAAMKEVHGRLERDGPVRTVIFGDHGCLDVDASVDVMAALPPRAAAGLHFVDSTMLRIWSDDAGLLRESAAALEAAAPGGRVVGREELEGRYRCAWNRATFGDLLFVAAPGQVFVPNFFQGPDTAPAGMHGYLPDVPDNRAALVAHGPGIPELDDIEPMTAVHDVLSGFLGTP